MGEFSAQDLDHTACALVKAAQLDAALFAALAWEVQRAREPHDAAAAPVAEVLEQHLGDGPVLDPGDY